MPEGGEKGDGVAAVLMIWNAMPEDPMWLSTPQQRGPVFI
jgi:hypothetical protein